MDLALLDREELFGLALHAVGQQQHTEAVTLLKHAVAHHPEDARLHYLLGVEYAQVGMYDRALVSLEQAIAQDATLDMAVFQLGLLYLTLGQPEQAITAWGELDRLTAEAPLRLFRDGLAHLIRDDFAACRDLLIRGIETNPDNAALNADMQQILDRIATLPQNDNRAKDEPTATEPSAGSLFIRAYASPDDERLH